MAENILGLLLVSSTTRDRHVLRYPPDATSPETRLSQPVYSRSTYTAKDTTVDHKSHRLFPRARSSKAGTTHFWSSVGSSGKAVTTRRGRSGASGTSGGPSDDDRGGGSGAQLFSRSPSVACASTPSSFHSHLTEVGSALSDDDSSSSSDDSDFDRLYDGGYSRSDTPRRYSSDTDTSASGALGAMSLRPNAPKPFTEIVPDGRRGSVVESEATARAAGRRSGGKGSAFVEEQYNYSLGYNLDFLGDLLCPPRAACNRKFEVSVDELVFIGHPVCTSPDGKWAYPSNDSDEDEDDARGAARGRRMNDKEKERQPSIGAAGAARAQELRPVREESPHTRFERLQDNTPSLTPLHVTPTPSVSSGAESGVPLGAGSGSGSGSVSGTTRNGKKEEDAGMLTMFHLVLIVDKPDPRPEGEADLAEVFSHLYREIAFKWTAAAFALQVRDDWVGKEVRKLTQIREKAITEGVPVVDCLRKCVEKSELAQSLHELFSALHKIKARPLNTHFTAMPTTVTINVGSIPITLAVPPPMLRNAEGPVSLEVSDGSSDDESDDEWAGVTGPDGLLLPKQPHLRIEPWQTLLMLHEEEDVLAAMATGRETARRNSRSQQEEDELLAGLIRACDISKPLHEIAHTLRYDLEGIVIPLVRELVQSKRAVLVDVVNIRLRSILVPTSIDNHLRTLTQHAVRWSVLFPYLPPLVPFLALISATPMPFRDLLPADAQAEPSRRDVYIRAITWLLRSDLVQQARVRARVVASPAVKDAAWRRLWHRRRNKWLRERTASMTSRASTGSRGSRPSFGANSMSQRAPSSSAAASVVLSPKAEMAALPRRSASGSVSAGTGASAAGGSEGGTSAALNPLETVLASRVPRLANAPPTSLDVTRTATTDSYLDYDSDLEMDSDVEGDGDGPAEDTRILFGEFSVNQQEPAAGTVPTFTGSFIFHPAQAQKDEARWLRIIREHNSDPVLRSRFDLCVQYFDGVTTFEEIMFRTSLSRRELDRIAYEYREDLLITVQP